MSSRTVGQTTRAGILIAAAFTLMGCAMTPERLPQLDRKFYYNLETPEERQAFLRLKKSPDRQAYLQQKGLWAQWLQLSPEEQNSAVNGQARVGQQAFVATMAFGLPADRRTQATESRSVEFLTFLRCTSGPKRNQYVRTSLACDGTSTETRVAVEKGRITEVRYVD